MSGGKLTPPSGDFGKKVTGLKSRQMGVTCNHAGVLFAAFFVPFKLFILILLSAKMQGSSSLWRLTPQAKAASAP
jgi:hypothetical protein